MQESYSQLSQDIHVCDFYDGKQDGYFVDVGANDGITLSNTYLLEKKYNWKGICIEPEPTNYDKLITNRSTICDKHVVFSKSNDIVEFAIMGNNGLLSGIADYVKRDPNRQVEIIMIPTMTLTDILDMYGAPRLIDYLTIDTEGTEIEVLKGLNMSKYIVGYLSIEHNYDVNKRKKIRDILYAGGYIYKCENKWDDDYFHRSIVEGI